MGYLDYAGLQYLWGKLKEKFAPKSHSHDDRYYTESEMDGKLNSKVNNNEAGADGLLSKLTTSWTATPTDNTYFIRQDTGGGDSFGRVKFSTLWNYIKGKADGTYQPKGSYATSGHTHDDRYYTESEIDGKLSGKAAISHTHDDRYYTESEVDTKLGTKASSDHTHGLNSSSLTKTVDNVTTNSWDMVGGNKDFLLRSLRMQAKAPDWLEGSYAAGIAFGGSDTKGVISHAYNAPNIKFAGGNGAAPVWWLRLTGTSGKTYNLNAMPPASHTHTKDQVGLGNVDNTADANKSVKYATTAGTADKANSVDWSKVQNKPSSYNPSSHTHNYAGSASAGGAAISANALNPTVTLTGGDKNTTGYRLIGQVSIVQWSNYRCVMLVNSRHQGAGLVSVTIGNNTNSITQENAYAEIKYWGSTNSGGVISSSSYQVYISSDGKTGYLFWLFHDYSPCSVRVLGSDFTISNGTWMTGIGSGYGKCIATTQINAASTADVAGVATVGVRDYNNANNTIKIGWSGADLDANTLSYVAGYTSDMKIHTASKDGVRSWLGLGNAAYKKIQSLSAVGHTDWKNQSTDDGYVPTMAFMAFWNGAFSGSGSSNLQYCDRGRFGTIVTKSTADFAPASGSNNYVRVYNSGTLGSTDNVSINDLAKQHFAMAMVNNATDNPLGAKKWIHAINMAWNNGVNSSWVSQIALGVQDSYGMWFRTGQGAITGRAWNRVYDSSYHPNADHASAADSATNATNATTATKLSSNAGSSVQPVYFSGGKPVAIGYTISSSVPANAKFTDTTYGVASSSSNGLMSSTDKTKLDDFSRVISIQKQIKLTTDWLDTGIAGNSLDTGTYVVQVSGFNSSYTQLYSEIYSGVMSWYSGTTNSGNSSEIFLHNAGLADNNNAIYLRTLRVAGSKTLKLQIACKVAATGTDILTFKFRRLI